MDYDSIFRELKPKKNPYRVPGFSFANRNESEPDEATRNLGPGSYDITKQKTYSIGTKFAKSNRFQKPSINANALGPGAYDANTSLPYLSDTSPDFKNVSKSTNMMSFSKASRPALFPVPDIQTGPGQYPVKRDFEDLKKYRDRSPSKEGADYYTGSSHLLKSYIINDTPGPGQYDSSLNISSGHKSSTGGFKIGTSTRNFIDPKTVTKQGLPGEIYYQYNNREVIGKDGPKLSFATSKRTNLSTINTGPGPAAYNPEKEMKNSKSMPKGTWGQAPRKILGSPKELELGPGPGEYTLYSPIGTKGTKMGKTAKLFQNDKISQKSPGPGQYDILTEFEEKRKEIERQLTLCHSRMLAKMGQSDVIVEEDNPFDGFVSPIRRHNHSVEGDSSPSMRASIMIKQKQTRDLSPTKTIWVEKAIRESVSPGPKYMIKKENIETNLGVTGVTFTHNARQTLNADEVKNNYPGPGWYVDKFKESDTSPISFATSKRKENPLLPEHTIGLPGPDHYDPVLEEPQLGQTFTKAIREITRRPEDVNKYAPKKRRYRKSDDEEFPDKKAWKRKLSPSK